MLKPVHKSKGDQPILIDVLDDGMLVRPGAALARIGETIQLSTAALEAFFFAGWRSDLFDLLVVAGAIEFSDVTRLRPSSQWCRCFDVRISVHDPAAWNRPEILDALASAVGFLTGDVWRFEFIGRRLPVAPVREQALPFPSSIRLIMPYSDGLDSRAVAALFEPSEGQNLVRVRLGASGSDQKNLSRRRRPFTRVPYRINVSKRERRESSARSRGFKFAVVTGIAALLADAKRIIVTESGQGALGPTLTVSAHAYPDYRVHPSFARRIEHLFNVLFGRSARYEFPRLWNTKGETIAAAAALSASFDWSNTRSCWQQSRQVTVNGKRRQCGVCAACMLRRMSMHAAGLNEPEHTYVWSDLSAAEFRNGAAPGFSLFTDALKEYAVAGVLHLDHLAALGVSDLHSRTLSRASRELASALGEEENHVKANLQSLLRRHREEWMSFLQSLGPSSFVRRLTSLLP
ncbi:MAG: hypothetical protein RLY86_3748 [Pseudomonadota bacterium]